MKPKKTWNEKLQNNKIYEIVRTDKKFGDIPEGSLLYISTPKEINEYVNNIPKGKSTLMKTMRKDLAIENNADFSCPITSGIFLRIVAEAAFEKYAETKSIKGITPFWRIIVPNSPLAKKLTFGQEFLLEMQTKEKIVFEKA